MLADVDLAIRDGEFVGVLGPNGSGKTTLMRAILGLLPPRRGTHPRARRSRWHAAIPPSATCRRRAARWTSAPDRLGLRRQRRATAIAGVCRCLDATARRDVAWALERVQATDLARRPLAETSGGERQRLLLAQALLGRPRLLLLDEPLISLDPHHQRAVVELTRTLQQELGIAVLFSAHEINPLLGALDRVLYLGDGHAALGTVEQVITGPVLSRLYGSPIDVVHVNGRIFVMSGGHDVERDAHQHDHGRHHVHV